MGIFKMSHFVAFYMIAFFWGKYLPKEVLNMLKFRIVGQELKRLDVTKVVSDTRNYLMAEFNLIDEEWRHAPVITATFDRTDKENCCYSIVLKGKICPVPWEVLTDEGIMEVSLQCGNCSGEKCITTNTVAVRVHSCGKKCGLIPTQASPGLYQQLVERVEKTEEELRSMIPITIEEISEIFSDRINKEE